MTTTQDPAGWHAICRHCYALIWCAWRAHDASYKRFDPDRETLHRCKEGAK